MTVGMELPESGDNVPTVKSTGPILSIEVSTQIQTDGLCAHPRIPSKPSKPLEVEATPIDCWEIASPGAIVTVSKYSVPKEEEVSI